ncbi:hypothetical protein [Lysobacter sp.]|uniref:hypothetical protein n=1 Tax=Lysobacter sp. TaxID=72226 RepID=UPI002D44B67E|nr:hypothetical protein [Lysobacter sp.]HZX77316.1 hypothetical protein [Lysobacter sp.]
MRELTVQEISLVNGAVSDDAAYGASLGGAVFLAGALLVPGIGTGVALAAWGGSLICSGLAIRYASR